MRAILVDIIPKNTTESELAYRFEELESLVRTYRGITVVRFVQKRDTADYETFVGSGKLEEIAESARELKADIVIIGNILKPAQIYNIGEVFRKAKLETKAWDRVDLILKIFAQHAKTPESRLQIELASIRHMGPRIFGMGMELSRQGGGIGTVGIGETNTERMRRHLREQELDIRRQIAKYERTREMQRARRNRQGYATFGIVGYTNAGKSTLMNALTKKGVLSEDKLFATLETSTGKAYLDGPDGGKNVLVSDTIGFIRELPPRLIEAFSSTLEDSIESDTLLHVVDAGDPHIADKMGTVDSILASIRAEQPRIIVFNKSDSLAPERRDELASEYAGLAPVFVSAATGEGIADLKSRMYSFIPTDLYGQPR